MNRVDRHHRDIENNELEYRLEGIRISFRPFVTLL